MEVEVYDALHGEDPVDVKVEDVDTAQKSLVNIRIPDIRDGGKLRDGPPKGRNERYFSQPRQDFGVII